MHNLLRSLSYLCYVFTDHRISLEICCRRRSWCGGDYSVNSKANNRVRILWQKPAFDVRDFKVIVAGIRRIMIVTIEQSGRSPRRIIDAKSIRVTATISPTTGRRRLIVGPPDLVVGTRRCKRLSPVPVIMAGQTESVHQISVADHARFPREISARWSSAVAVCTQEGCCCWCWYWCLYHDNSRRIHHRLHHALLASLGLKSIPRSSNNSFIVATHGKNTSPAAAAWWTTHSLTESSKHRVRREASSFTLEIVSALSKIVSRLCKCN